MHITDHFIILLGKGISIKPIATFASTLLTGFSYQNMAFSFFIPKVIPKAWQITQTDTWNAPQEEFQIIQSPQSLITLLILSALLDVSDPCFINKVSDSTESPKGS